jgi:MinD-like ATPase involved in chromosome partitioning or flagellar assembly
MRTRVGNNTAGLFVLAGETSTARRRVLDAAIYREATARLENHFTISLIDCGSTMDSPVTQQVLADLDALIVVSSPWLDGASAARHWIGWAPTATPACCTEPWWCSTTPIGTPTRPKRLCPTTSPVTAKR